MVCLEDVATAAGQTQIFMVSLHCRLNCMLSYWHAMDPDRLSCIHTSAQTGVPCAEICLVHTLPTALWRARWQYGTICVIVCIIDTAAEAIQGLFCELGAPIQCTSQEDDWHPSLRSVCKCDRADYSDGNRARSTLQQYQMLGGRAE